MAIRMNKYSTCKIIFQIILQVRTERSDRAGVQWLAECRKVQSLNRSLFSAIYSLFNTINQPQNELSPPNVSQQNYESV